MIRADAIVDSRWRSARWRWRACWLRCWPARHICPLNQALAALGGGGDELSATIVRTIRLPRTISAFAVGSLLGLAGVLLQALFRNPLADPFVLGVSGGASVGALAGMLAGLALGGTGVDRDRRRARDRCAGVLDGERG